jgi:D-serine deaminase-like pyridoxal phosphate-dependent protein
MQLSHPQLSHIVSKPTLIIDEQIARSNIRKMKVRAINSNVLFRPHFKTHQSLTIGKWFKEEGCTAITVSSVDMASYFLSDGWNDITIAAHVNVLQIQELNNLAQKISLNVVVDNMTSLAILLEKMQNSIGVFLKIDTGSQRCGLLPEMAEEIVTMCTMIKQSSIAVFKGLLIHSGHTYRAKCVDDIRHIYDLDKKILTELKSHLQQYCNHDIIISIGDTPGCTTQDNYSFANEIRPGNFVFYDLFQLQLGVCNVDEISCFMACPISGIYPNRNEIVIYGGAVHFSKDSLEYQNKQIFGMAATFNHKHGLQIIEDIQIEKLWQEHGVLKISANKMQNLTLGDIMCFIPVHSCLALDAVREVKNTEGNHLNIMQKPWK